MSQHPSPASGQDLTEFYRDRHPQLQSYLYWQVRSQEIAEELAQETYLRFLKQATPQPILDLNAFLFTIAANLARDHLRSNKRQQQRFTTLLLYKYPAFCQHKSYSVHNFLLSRR